MKKQQNKKQILQSYASVCLDSQCVKGFELVFNNFSLVNYSTKMSEIYSKYDVMSPVHRSVRYIGKQNVL